MKNMSLVDKHPNRLEFFSEAQELLRLQGIPCDPDLVNFYADCLASGASKKEMGELLKGGAD